MSISSPGIGSNLDVNNIVSQLLAIDRKPIDKLDKTTASFQAKLTGFGTLKSMLSQFQSAVTGLSDMSRFQNIKATVADTAIASVNGSSIAVPGTYALNVMNLAQAQKLSAAGQASATDAIGNGAATTLSFDLGTITKGTFDPGTGKYGGGTTFASAGNGVKTITIDATNNTLSGMRDAINKGDLGVTATIINDGSGTPYRLSLSVTGSGVANSLKLSVSGGQGPSGPLGSLLSQDPAGAQALSETVTAQNANFTLDGISVTKQTNVVTDAIAGVTLTLAKASASATTPTNITIARDTTAVATSINNFVKAFNDINQGLKDAASYDPATKTASILNGEASVRSIQSQLHGALTAPIAGSAGAFTLLSQVGVTIQKDGSLGVDSAKLSTALDKNFSSIASLFAAVGTSTDVQTAYAGSTARTSPGAYALNVSRMASSGSLAGSVAAATTIDASNDTLQVNVDGTVSSITLTRKTYGSAAELANELQSKINGNKDFSALGIKVTVTQSAGILSIGSLTYGAASKVLITVGAAKTSLGLDGGTAVTGVDVAGTINGVAATGSGQTLIAAKGNAAEGLTVLVTAGTTGNRGTINYTQGYAYQLKSLATAILSDDGPLAARTKGLNASLQSVARNKDQLTARLADTEKRYRAQFTTLDSVISKMSTTSSFLTQQLANLPKNS